MYKLTRPNHLGGLQTRRGQTASRGIVTPSTIVSVPQSKRDRVDTRSPKDNWACRLPITKLSSSIIRLISAVIQHIKPYFTTEERRIKVGSQPWWMFIHDREDMRVMHPTVIAAL
ncbi:hypothetical protein AAMO2058_001344500 [Amorphochlora amoebiformis]